MIRSTWRHTPSSLRVLMASSFIMVIGFYSLVPRLSLYLGASLGWSMALAGTVLAWRQVVQQGLSFGGGMFVDRLGPRRGLMLGLIIRGIGFIMFGLSETFWQFCLASILSGLGGCLFDPAEKKAFEAAAKGEHREGFIAMREVVDNCAFAAAAFIGVIIAGLDFKSIAFLSGGLYLVVALIVFRLVRPQIKLRAVSRYRASFLIPLRDRAFLTYTLILTGYYYLACQLYSIVPRQIVPTGESSTRLSIVYGFVAGLVILFQVPVSYRLKLYPYRFRLIGAGTFLMGLGHYFLAYPHWAAQTAFVLFYSAGLVISAPMIFEVVPYFGSKRLRGTYYGFNNYACGIGGVLSTTLGGYLYDVGEKLSFPLIPSFASLGIGALVMVLLHRFEPTLDYARPGEIAEPLPEIRAIG